MCSIFNIGFISFTEKIVLWKKNAAIFGIWIAVKLPLGTQRLITDQLFTFEKHAFAKNVLHK